MKEDRKKAGIIGCGGIAHVHAWALRSMKDVELVAFCDSEKYKAKAFAGSDALVCDDWRKFCKLDLDVVHICTPHYLHAPMAVELLRSGKAVFVEKPCAITFKQFRELETEDKKHPGKLGFCFQNRYNETTRLIDKIVSEGRLGKILGARAMVTWRRDEDYYESSLWKGKRATEGGGVLINQAIHTVDLLGYLCGFGIGMLFKMDAARKKAVSVEIGMQNSGLATSLAGTAFPDLSMATVPGAIFSVWHNISGAILASVLRRIKDEDGLN